MPNDSPPIPIPRELPLWKHAAAYAERTREIIMAFFVITLLCDLGRFGRGRSHRFASASQLGAQTVQAFEPLLQALYHSDNDADDNSDSGTDDEHYDSDFEYYDLPPNVLHDW